MLSPHDPGEQDLRVRGVLIYAEICPGKGRSFNLYRPAIVYFTEAPIHEAKDHLMEQGAEMPAKQARCLPTKIEAGLAILRRYPRGDCNIPSHWGGRLPGLSAKASAAAHPSCL